MSEIQSFGSNCHRPSQTRKFSIGVIAEISAKKTPGSMKGQEVAVPAVAVANCHQRDSIDSAQVTTKAKQIEPLEQSGSLWSTIKANNENSTSPTVSHAKVIRTKTKMGSMHDEPSGFKCVTLDHSVEISPTRTSFLQPDGISDGIVCGRKGEKHTSSQIPCTIAPEQGVVTSNIGYKDENTVNRKSEALRMKLWELLGTVSSPNKEKHNLQTLEVDGDSLQPDGVSKQAGAKAVGRRQNSDTIETDSESPDCASKRPITRSFARKRAPTKFKQDAVQCGMASSSREKSGEINIFSFQEGCYVGLRGAATSSCPSTGNRRKNGRNDAQIEPRNKVGQRKMHERKRRQLFNKQQNTLATEKSCSGGSSRKILYHAQSHVNGNIIDPKGPSADKDFPRQTRSKPVLHGGINGPQLPEYPHLRENVGNSSIENFVDPQHNQDIQYTQRENAGMENNKFSVHPKRNVHGIGQVTDENDISPAAQKSGSRASNANGGGSHGSDSNINRKSIDPRSTSIEKDLPENPTRTKLDHREGINSPSLPGDQTQRGQDIRPASPGHQNKKIDVGDSSFKNIMDPQDGAESPTFGTTSPIASHSLGSRHKETKHQNRAHSLAEPETMSSGGGIFSFGNFASDLVPSRNGRYGLQDSPPRSPAPQMQENDVENTSPRSSSEDTGSESCEEGPEAEAFSPETGTAEKLNFVLHRNKRLRSFKGIQNREYDPSSVSPKESNSMRKLDEQNLDEEAEEDEEEEENGLTRAIAMLALALEKLKSKVKLLTSKRSSEILTSVAERIHAQLHGAESQIRTDICKLTSLSKQKRKRLETEFQEQEEHLRVIHGNFKKEISQLLEDCRGMIQGLEINHVELKRIVDKQKASHQKLLLQAQEAVEIQLHDAEKRVTAIHQSAREQMLQLKLVIAESLEGGVLF